MKTQISEIVAKFEHQKILVIGDFILDVYLDGVCRRVAPEAGIPILDVNKHHACLGGAGNVVSNLHDLGAQTSFITVMGQDDAAKTAINLLKEKGVHSLCIHFAETGPTLTKTRLRNENQLIYRVDVGQKVNMTPTVINGLLRDIEKAYPKCDAVLISDYDKGSINFQVIELLQKLRETNDKILIVDAKDYEKYKQLSPNIIKPNYQEGLRMTQEEPAANRVQQAMAWSEALWAHSHAQMTTLTLDKDGVICNRRNKTAFHYSLPTASQPQNVSGAGDTFLSALTLACLAGASDYEAIKIGCTAASTGIQKKLTASCTQQELLYGLLAQQGKILENLSQARTLATTIQKGKKIVLTNGCFDIFHSGHIHYLRQARSLGDMLIVGINTDPSVQRLKGISRPVNTLSDRMEVLKGLECVDYIVPFGDKNNDTPKDLISAILPDLFVKGEDYKNQDFPERELLKSLGIEIQFLPYIPHQSTSKIIDRVQKSEQIFLKKIS